jgi:hypothetical protein
VFDSLIRLYSKPDVGRDAISSRADRQGTEAGCGRTWSPAAEAELAR